MINVTPDVIFLVSDRVADKTQPLDQILADLNAPIESNPKPQENIPNPFDFQSLASLISVETMGKLVNYIHFPAIIQDVRNRDRVAIGFWASALVAGAVLKQTEADQIFGVISASTPDPNWKSKLSWAEINLGEEITLKDIKQVAQYGKWPV